jgi:selenocysteine lyase/cysteine desulfurase
MTSPWWKVPPGYLNTASFGVPPLRTQEAVTVVIDEWAGGRLSFAKWLESARQARQSISQLLNVPPDWVALGSSSAQLLNAIAWGLPDGSRVMAPVNEHNSNLIPYLNQAHRGVTVECVPLASLASRVVSGVSVVSSSAVQSLTGEVADLDAIRSSTLKAGALFCLDVSQACGWLPLDGRVADVLVCSVYKWLCSPIGGAFLVMAPDLSERFRAVIPSWITGKDVVAAPYGTDFDWAGGTFKFDTQPNLVSMIGTRASVDVISEIGVETIHEHNVALANRFRLGLDLAPSNSAIVTIPRLGAAERLARVGVRATEWRGNLRVSFHFYNTVDDVDLALAGLRD